jgi:hypothetical protein
MHMNEQPLAEDDFMYAEIQQHKDKMNGKSLLEKQIFESFDSEVVEPFAMEIEDHDAIKSLQSFLLNPIFISEDVKEEDNVVSDSDQP